MWPAPVLLLVGTLCGVAGCGWRDAASPMPQPTTADRDASIRTARETLLAAIARDLTPDPGALARARSAYAAAGHDAVGSVRGLELVAGLEQAMAGDVAAARGSFASVVGDDEELLAGYSLGLLALVAGESLEAWGEFDQIMRLRPEWLWARVLRAAADAGLGASDGIAVLTEAVMQWPRRPELTAALGRALEKVGSDPEAGAEWYARAVELGAHDRFVIDRFATFSLERGEAERVRTLLAPLVAAHPSEAYLHLHLGRAQASLGEVGPAAGSLGAALRLEPANIETRVQLATHLANVGELVAAGPGMVRIQAQTMR